MTLSDESESIDQLSEEDSGVTDDELKAWGDVWLRFYEALKQDIVDTSKSLESEGYKLIEAMSGEEEVSWEFSTENYIVRLSEMPSRDFDMDGWDEEIIHDTWKSMIDGEERVVGLKAEVLDRETETALGEDSLYGIVYATGDRTYGGYRSELVSNAIDSARGFINRLKAKVA